MDKINNSVLNTNITNIKTDNKNNDTSTKSQSHLLHQPIEDTVSFGEEKANKPKKNNTLKWVLGIAAAGLGTVLAFKFHKNVRAKEAMESHQLDMALNEAEEAVKKLNEEIKKQDEEFKKIYEGSKQLEEKADIEHDKLIKNIDNTQKEYLKKQEIIKKQDEEIKKLDEEFRRLSKELDEQLEKEKEANKKFWEEINNSWKKSEEESKKSWEKFWEDMNNNWKNFNFKGDIPKTAMKNKAQSAVEVFKNFGKGADGEVFNEIKSLGEVENITEESLKKAHWKMFKKYGPMMNAGTEKEKAEATEIMQKINPACDDIKAYLKSK